MPRQPHFPMAGLALHPCANRAELFFGCGSQAGARCSLAVSQQLRGCAPCSGADRYNMLLLLLRVREDGDGSHSYHHVKYIMSTTHHQEVGKCNSSEACEFTAVKTLSGTNPKVFSDMWLLGLPKSVFPWLRTSI